MTKKFTPLKLSTRWSLCILVLLIICGVGAAVYHLKPWAKHVVTSQSHTTSKLSSAQSNFTGAGEKTMNHTPSPSPNNSATDTGGSIPQGDSTSNTWSKSKDGTSIIVMGPASGVHFSSGDTLYGTAASSPVFYELEDDISGVIFQGQANVVNGKFSVKLNFSTNGTQGRVNVFNQASDGTESNNVSVDVRFK